MNYCSIGHECPILYCNRKRDLDWVKFIYWIGKQNLKQQEIDITPTLSSLEIMIFHDKKYLHFPQKKNTLSGSDDGQNVLQVNKYYTLAIMELYRFLK